ncbi:RdRP-domain-containing protein [Suillus fuscotomentosus]|uniref:RNA-dependent RNA polymerase n=1 Tax=Suillus fuscotomentosus TaxID=1912939 RepID=A0AAD4ELY8_9AGAM|nr:RdRP-domain-containing protein [Suillus fuscotomentosus]KAG1908506.1 RdRP-domain-containing protein [Suillus fuscotomentosus]
MEIFLRNIAFAVTQEDLTLEFAKILHKPPFSTSPPLNFEFQLFYKSHPNGKRGILALPTEDSGITLLRAYGDVGIAVKGRQILLSKSTQSINNARIMRLNTVPWVDPVKLREEKERLLQQSRPFPLLCYSFGRFNRDSSFSSEFALPGLANVSCDLERRQVRFTVTPHDDSDDLFWTSTSIASYAQLKIAALVGNQDDDTHILFIRADAPPVFSVENDIGGLGLTNTSPQRLAGLTRYHPMPPGSYSLMLAFSNQPDAETFMYACRNRLHLRYSPVPHVRIHDHTSNSNPVEELHEFLSEIPYELAFQVEKTVTTFVFTPMEIFSLKEAIISLYTEHGPDASEIFQSFASEHEGHNAKRKPRRKRRAQWHASQEDLTSLLGQVIHEFTREHQKPLRLLAPPPQSGVYQSYHMILTPTRHILEGPLPDQSNSVLRKYNNHECFLRVTFQDENRSKLRRDFESSITDLLKERYRPILLRGYRVAGRQFQFLGYSMSGLRDHSVWFMTPFTDDSGTLLDAESIRGNLGDFSQLVHQPARLAARWSQAFSGTDPSITLLPEEIDYDYPDRKSPSGNVGLAKDIWRSLQKGKKRPAKLRNIPSAFQFRLGGAKGMVVQDPTIEGKLVRLRPSQIKFDGQENLTFDVQSTSAKPKAMFLNRPLIVLMEFLGVDTSRIVDLQDDAITKAQSVRSSSLDASKVIQQHGLGASFHLPSLLRNLSSILQLDVGNTEEETSQSRWTSELIESTLHCVETHILRELKYRAHIEVPGSYTLLGVSDEWGCLREGEVYAAVYDERTGLNKQILGEAAITRSPQIHPGDLQVVTAVDRPELAHLKNVVVFSCEGQRALASCLGGGDLDGDDFNLILDPKLLPTHYGEPGEYQALPIKRTEAPCDISDVVEFVFDYIEADLVGLIAIHHLRFSDLEDPGCAECMELAKLASHAVDFPKSGTPVNFTQLPRFRSRNQPKPDFLAKEGADLNSDQYYNSKKLLGQLYRRVPVKRWIPQEWNEDRSPSDGASVEDALSRVSLRNLGLSGLTPPTQELIEEMTYLLEAYCEQLLVIGQSHTILKNKDSHVSEAELLSGTIMANWSDHHRRRDAVTAMNLQTRELVRAVRAELLVKDLAVSEAEMYSDEEDDYDDWTFREEFDDTEQRSMAETFKRSWAAWCVAEDTLKEEPRMYGAQSFGLIALGRMLEIVKESLMM